MPMENFNKLIMHPDFKKTVEELSSKKIFLPSGGEEQNYNYLNFSQNGALVVNLEDIKSYPLDIHNGCRNKDKFLFSAYDESIIKFSALEGTAYFTSHSLVIAGEEEYAPINLVTFYFYTRSRLITSKSKYIKFSSDIELESTRDCVVDKKNFLIDYAPEKSLLFIDGPLIAGNLYTYMVSAIKEFLKKEIIPVFFVKNSLSNLVTENIDGLSGQYNSDMHWLNTVIKAGERSCFFKYQDKKNEKNSKAFCYIKAIEPAIQRVEFHIDTFLKYKGHISDIMDLIFYLLLVQGSGFNPQLRPIAIAEAYARSVLKFVDINKYLKDAKISPTINQVRFGG